jgi:hypothetical protein
MLPSGLLLVLSFGLSFTAFLGIKRKGKNNKREKVSGLETSVKEIEAEFASHNVNEIKASEEWQEWEMIS